MKRKALLKKAASGIYRYIIFFMLVAFVITSCMSLFVSTLVSTLGITLSASDIGDAAKLTFLNVVFLTLLFTVIDMLRRKLTVDRPIKQITQAAEKITKGDFSVRIQPQSKALTDGGFNEIVSCFNKMAEELNSVETLRTDFIANVSHEMKTPLAVMQNYGVLLQTKDLPENERIAYAKGITENSRRMADAITNILKLNRLENQQIYPNVVRFDLGEQLCECLLQYESVWEASDIEISTDLEEDVTVEADDELLSLVWSNLFSNAFKFTPPGRTVSLKLYSDEKYAVVKVSDTGCGMTPQVGMHIFEKFYQGDTSHSVCGNGLGLALVKRIIEILHGEIHVESTVDVGTTFTVKIRRRAE